MTIAGEHWDFVAEATDRGSLDKMDITHGTNAKEHELFLKAVADRDMFELIQHDFTHRSGAGISRIDLVYGLL